MNLWPKSIVSIFYDVSVYRAYGKFVWRCPNVKTYRRNCKPTAMASASKPWTETYGDLGVPNFKNPQIFHVFGVLPSINGLYMAVLICSYQRSEIRIILI